MGARMNYLATILPTFADLASVFPAFTICGLTFAVVVLALYADRNRAPTFYDQRRSQFRDRLSQLREESDLSHSRDRS
jgi:hypothetical protein